MPDAFNAWSFGEAQPVGQVSNRRCGLLQMRMASFPAQNPERKSDHRRSVRTAPILDHPPYGDQVGLIPQRPSDCRHLTRLTLFPK